MNDPKFDLAIANAKSVSVFMRKQKVRLGWWNFPHRIVIDAKATSDVGQWHFAPILAKFSEDKQWSD